MKEMNKASILYIDGSVKGNPGDAGIGGVILSHEEKVLSEFSKYIGITTNNVAEYKALIYGLGVCKKLGIERVEIRTDSNLLINQIEGKFRIRNSKLIKLAIEARRSLRDFKEWKLVSVNRKDNKIADSLANLAMRRCDSESRHW